MDVITNAHTNNMKKKNIGLENLYFDNHFHGVHETYTQ